MNNDNISKETSNTTSTLNPYFVTGFADGEGCFAEYKSLIAGMNSTQTVFSKDINPTIKPSQETNNTTKED